MAKMKKKKSNKKFSEAVNAKPAAKKLNPFEVHINRKKYDVLGMKSKAEKGLPGISRSKSLKKRKATLLQEYKLKDKKNLFVDKRIGEKNSAMTAEDKIIARYTAERIRFHSKKSIYNLGDDEELTHKGQTLTEIEKFDNPRSDDEEDEEESGKLDSDFVGDAHFGGGIFKKVDGESKNRKDLIDQLIAESIKRKAEKQKLRQETKELTQKLDTEWKELLPLVTATKRSRDELYEEMKKDNKYANYDILSRKLKFEARGQPSDRLKSEEEIAKEEKEKLEELERDRLQRMMGETNIKKINHRSADDMNDGFDLSNEPELVVSYKNGVINMVEKEVSSDSDDDAPSKSQIEKEVRQDEEEESGKEDEEAEASENEGDSDDNDKEEDDESGHEEEEEEDESDNLSDLKDSDESDNEEPKTKKQNKKGAIIEKEEKSKDQTLLSVEEETEKDANAKAEAMEAARKELPYTFNIPKEYEEFESLMKNYDSDFQSVIVERMIKCHHPSLKEEFKEDLDLLFTFLLQHLQDCASEQSTRDNCFKILDRLAPWFYDLTQWNPQNCSFGLLDVIKEKYQDFLKNPKVYPSLDTIIFLKLVSILFPTSDFRHLVVTPSLLFMQQMLCQCKIQSSTDLSTGLVIATLVYEYCALSKRFIPEAVNFIYGVLRLAHSKDSKISILPPFELKTHDLCNLIVDDKSRTVDLSKMSVNDLLLENSSDEFKCRALSLALHLLSEFCDFWNGEPSAILVFEQFVPVLKASQFSECLQKKVEDVLEKILSLKTQNLKMLVFEKKKPKPLRLYEPNIEEVYSLKKFKPMGEKKAERAKLMHKYKREMKGALREIRRDRSFLSKLKFKETQKSDIERHRKVREILGSAAEQAGELNRLQRQKK